MTRPSIFITATLALPLLSSRAQDSIEGKFLTNIRQVTDGMERAGEGYFSPDGKQIIYQAIPPGYPFYQIYTQALVNGQPKLLSTGRGRTTCSYFSPDGKKVIFASSHLDPHLDKTEADERKQQAEDKAAGVRRRYKWDFDPYMDIYEMDLASGERKRLTDAPGYDAEGAYSPDGKLIAFCSTRKSYPELNPNLYVMHADGTHVRQLTDAPGYNGGPFISPDGKWVIFRSDRKVKDMLQLFVIDIDGKNETQLTDHDGVDWGPYWHPQQPWIIWSGADHSNKEVRPNYDLAKYEVKEGKFTLGKPIRVTDYEGADVLPVFSPDGKQLMWSSGRTKDRLPQLFIADFKLPE